MESDHLTTRTYTALTCKLIVSTTNDPSGIGSLGSNLAAMPNNRQTPIDFILELDRSDCGDSEHIVLQGNLLQLNLLQRVVSEYITELVAKFPLPNMGSDINSDSISSATIVGEASVQENRDVSTPEIDTDNSIDSRLDPNHNSLPIQSGLMNNLPGLRNISAQSMNSADTDPQTESGISKLFGGWNKSSGKKSKKSKQRHKPLGADAGVKSGFGQREVEDLAAARAGTQQSTTTPYLTGNERSLDRQLHLGDLANSSSGDTITLSPIQLFDLSTVLDEHAAEDVVTKQERSVTFSQANIPGHHHDQVIDVDATTASLSRLPNLPRMATGSIGSSQNSQVFNRTRTPSRSRPSVSLLSVIPWAAAAAVAVGVPLLLFDSKPNPLKDATSKVKMPNLEGVKKTVTAAMSPPVIDPEPTTATTPKQWDQQPVAAPTTNLAPIISSTQQPPTTPNAASTGIQSQLPNNPPVNTGIQPTQTNVQIGTAPLPSTLEGQPSPIIGATAKIPAQNTRPAILSTLPRDGAKSGIAPNPLKGGQFPLDADSISPNRLLRSASKPGLNSLTPATSGSGAKQAGQNGKTSSAIKPGTVSVSTQPILLPSDLPGIGIDAAKSSPMPINPTAIKPSRPGSKTIKPKANPTTAAKNANSSSGIPTGVGVVPQPLFEQGTPIPANPNFIDPVQLQTGGNDPDVQSLPIVPASAPVNTSSNWPSDADSPAIQATRNYFQSKWKPSGTQQNPLQYVVQISGKSGLVRSISPQGAAAITYLKQSKIIKAGQKLVAPAAGGTDQKIRVVLQPDGNVDSFMEP